MSLHIVGFKFAKNSLYSSSVEVVSYAFRFVFAALAAILAVAVHSHDAALSLFA